MSGTPRSGTSCTTGDRQPKHRQLYRSDPAVHQLPMPRAGGSDGSSSDEREAFPGDCIGPELSSTECPAGEGAARSSSCLLAALSGCPRDPRPSDGRPGISCPDRCFCCADESDTLLCCTTDVGERAHRHRFLRSSGFPRGRLDRTRSSRTDRTGADATTGG
jgi:hypothetical protein